jgi:hypothetical protein
MIRALLCSEAVAVNFRVIRVTEPCIPERSCPQDCSVRIAGKATNLFSRSLNPKGGKLFDYVERFPRS